MEAEVRVEFDRVEEDSVDDGRNNAVDHDGNPPPLPAQPLPAVAQPPPDAVAPPPPTGPYLATVGAPASTYFPYLCRLMSFHHGTEYDPKTQPMFEPDVLGTLTPTVILRWMHVMVYGVPDPPPGARSTHGRSSSIEFAKKAVSFFMPNRLMGWNSLRNEGNPTRSLEVNNLIKAVKKDEVRKVGKKSSARRPITKPEFRKVIQLLEAQGDFDSKYRYTAMLKQQFHLIGRSDDIANLETQGLKNHPDFDFAASMEVRWSKNVLEERDCPPQILLGANDPDYCVLLAHVIYLEPWCSHGCGRHSKYLYCDDRHAGSPHKVKVNYQKRCRACFNHPEYLEVSRLIDGPCGTHSVRKFPSSWARKNGCSTDDIEIRGRWKSGGGRARRVVNRYIDPEQQFIDCKCAAALCVGGAVKYVLKEDTNVTKQWMRENVVPGLVACFGTENTICDVLAPVLLWACFEPTVRGKVPQAIRDRVDAAYTQIRRLDPDENPVKKVPLTVYRAAEQVCIDECLVLDGAHHNDVGPQAATQGATQVFAAQQEQIGQLLGQINQLQGTVTTLQLALEGSMTAMRTHFGREFGVVNRNINRIAIQPPRRVVAGAVAAAAAAAPPAVPTDLGYIELSPNPRTLADLWTEYTHGLGGRKAACDFTPSERGRFKYKYSRRKNVWDVISRHVAAGYSAPAAIAKIHQCYGANLGCSAIQTAIQRDKARGGHPNLRILQPAVMGGTMPRMGPAVVTPAAPRRRAAAAARATPATGRASIRGHFALQGPLDGGAAIITRATC